MKIVRHQRNVPRLLLHSIISFSFEFGQCTHALVRKHLCLLSMHCKHRIQHNKQKEFIQLQSAERLPFPTGEKLHCNHFSVAFGLTNIIIEATKTSRSHEWTCTSRTAYTVDTGVRHMCVWTGIVVWVHFGNATPSRVVCRAIRLRVLVCTWFWLNVSIRPYRGTADTLCLAKITQGVPLLFISIYPRQPGRWSVCENVERFGVQRRLWIIRGRQW